jgi:hypothetical protein
MGWRTALTLLLVLVMAEGCARMFPRPRPGQVYVMRSTVDEAELAPYLGRGSGTIEGQAVVGRGNGETETCRGTGVLAVPAIDYVREGYEAARDGYVVENPPNPLLRDVVRKADCDRDGYFTFDGLPDGEWFVSTEITWRDEGDRRGGTFGKIVDVYPRETTRVFISGDDRFKR